MMWIVLICASFCELGFTVFMKLSDGFKNLKYTILTIITVSMSIFLLSVAIKESREWKKLMFMGLILVGVIGLRLSA